MTATAIELTPAELELIEAKRAEKAAAEERKAAEEAIREERRRKERERFEAAVNAKAVALRKADTDGILFQTEDNGPIMFMLNGREEEISIEEHRAVHTGSWRAHSCGIKYRLTGSYNDYNRRYYTNPKSVIKKIKEFQEAAETKARLARVKADLKTRALEEVRAKYPNANVEFEQGYSYNNRRSGFRHAPDRIKVTTDNGSVTFRYHEKDTDGPIEFRVYSREIGGSISDKVNALILG